MKLFLPASAACAAVVAAAVLAGCTQKPAANVLARVGDKDITVADFKAEIERRQAAHQPLPDRQTLLDQMIDREAFLQQASASGLDSNPDVRRASEDILINKYKETQLEPKLTAAKVAPEEVRAAYDKDLQHYTVPAKVKLAIVLIAVESRANSNQVAEAESRANDAYKMAAVLPANTRGFGNVAADFSDDQVTRYRGGDAGWFAADSVEDRWPSDVLAAGFALKNIGDQSDVLRSRDGFYLVKKLDARPSTAVPFEQVRGVIERRLLIARQQETEAVFRAQSRQASNVSTNLALLATTTYPNLNPGKLAAAQFPGLPKTP
jgi:parvulin-like peptidyl-prolyl isomerase